MTTASIQLRLLLCCIVPMISAEQYAPYSQLSPSIGYDSRLSLHYPASAASVYCPTDANGNPGPDSSCLPVDTQRTCFTKDMLALFLTPTSELFQSLYPRYDISLLLENQGQASAKMQNELFRILASEVYGYSVKIIQNDGFRTQLPRCAQGAFDYHLQIWRDDWSSQEYIDYLLGGANKNGLPDTPATCSVVGSSGSGVQAWFADTFSVTAAAKQRPRPLALGHYLSYELEEGVAGLPRFNLSEALVDKVNTWFIPPQCRNVSQLCGVAYGFNIAFGMGIAEQQITNLNWLVALKFIPGISSDQYAAMIRERLTAQQQLLFIYNIPDSLTANSNIYTHVSLPDPTGTCYPQDRPSPTLDGIGPVVCDFKPQNLMKIMKDNSDTDYTDSNALFQRYEIPHEIMLDLLSQMDATLTQSRLSNYTIPALTEADVACKYLRNSSSIWSAWFQTATPRRYTVQLSTAATSVLIAFLSFYMLLTILCMYLIYRYRAHEVIRKSSYTFNQMIVFGSLFVYASVIIAIQSDTKATCVLSQFAMSLGFCLFYGSLLVKTYRIDRLFTAAESLRAVSLPDKKLMLYLAAYGAVDLLIVILWSGIDPPHPELRSHSTNSYADISVCSSQSTSYFRAALLILRGIVLIVGAVFAVRIRDIEECYNESRYLALITYNILVVSAIVVLIPYASSNEPSIIIGSWFGGCTISVFGSLMTFILPKLHTIKVPQKVSRRSSTLTPNKQAPGVGNTTTGGGDTYTNASMLTVNNSTGVPLSSAAPSKGNSPPTGTKPFPQPSAPLKRASLNLQIPHIGVGSGSSNTSTIGLTPNQITLQVTPTGEDEQQHSAPPSASIASTPLPEDAHRPRIESL